MTRAGVKAKEARRFREMSAFHGDIVPHSRLRPERNGRYPEPQKLLGGSWRNVLALNSRDYGQSS